MPLQSEIYHALLNELKATPKPTLQITVPSFLNEALLIYAHQYVTYLAIMANIDNSRCEICTRKEKKSESSASLKGLCDQLRNCIDKWHKLQKDVMPHIGDVVVQQAISGKFADSPEKEVLYIPSDFSAAQRIK